MVEDAEDECTVDNVPTSHVYNLPRKSREGPKKGSAGDSKKVVLNSLLTPFDVSKSPESINLLKTRSTSTDNYVNRQVRRRIVPREPSTILV